MKKYKKAAFFAAFVFDKDAKDKNKLIIKILNFI